MELQNNGLSSHNDNVKKEFIYRYSYKGSFLNVPFNFGCEYNPTAWTKDLELPRMQLYLAQRIIQILINDIPNKKDFSEYGFSKEKISHFIHEFINRLEIVFDSPYKLDFSSSGLFVQEKKQIIYDKETREEIGFSLNLFNFLQIEITRRKTTW